MIERTGFVDTYELSCDVCGEEAGEEFDTFQEAVEWKRDKDNGWLSRKIDGEWHDLCADCKDYKKATP